MPTYYIVLVLPHGPEEEGEPAPYKHLQHICGSWDEGRLQRRHRPPPGALRAGRRRHHLPRRDRRAARGSFPEKRTRTPVELGFRPSPTSMIPALTSSSLNFPISIIFSRIGITPDSD